MLDIRLLGSPRVYLNGELFTIKRRVTRALFFYLATNPKPVGRLRLCDFLWGEEGNEKEQRRKLRGALNNLRKAFPDRRILESYHGMVSLVKSDIRIDVREFLSAVDEMRRFSSLWQKGQTFPPNLYKNLVNAANLWHGATFIDSGDMYISSTSAEWWLEKNRELKHDQLNLFVDLARLEDAFGKPQHAIAWAEKALVLDDYNEISHFVLLQSLKYTGQIAKARQLYRSLEERREEEFGEMLSGRILSLGQELFSQEEASQKHARPNWAIRPSARVPFVGQDDLIQQMRQNYLNGKITLVLGEAGAGKTRLVQEFYQSLETPPELLLVPCHLASENIPYQPLADMLRKSIPKETWLKMPLIWVKPIAMLLPELHEWRDDLPEKAESSYAKTVLFEAIKKLLEFEVETHPRLFFIDDIQWADSATLTLLAYLLEQFSFSQKNIRLVIASRVEEGNLEFERLFLDSPNFQLEQIEVHRLDEENISALAFHVLQEELSPKILTHLLRETGGNPFFVLEMLLAIWALPKRGNLSINLPIPSSIKGLIKRRLENLSPLAREILLLAATQGNPFGIALLEKTALLSTDDLACIIDELEDAQLVREESKEKTLKYAFVHDKIRESLVASLTPVQNRSLHRKVAQALDEMGGEFQDAQAAILAEHYQKAGDFSSAFEHWLSAGNYAFQLFSIDDTVVAYKRAEALIPQVSLSNEKIYDLYANWGMMLLDNDNPDALENVMQRFLEIANQRGSELLIGAALDGMSGVCMARNQFEKGLAYTEDALPYLNISEHVPAQMNALNHRGVFLYMLNRFTASRENFQRSIELGEGEEDSTILYSYGNANYQMATILTGMGWPQIALSYAKQSQFAMRLASPHHGKILPLSIMGLANYYLANYKEGREYALQSASLAIQVDSRRMIGYSSAYAGLNETELADFGSAWEHAQKAIQIGEQQRHPEITSMGYKIMGDIYIHLDAFPQAANAYKQSVDGDPGSFVMLENLVRLGVTLGLLGKPEAESTLHQALDRAKKAGLDIIYLNGKALELSLFVLRGNLEAFEENLPFVRKELQARTHSDTVFWLDYIEAQSALRLGKIEQALSSFKKIIRELDDYPLFWIKFRTLRFYANTLHSLGRDDEIPHTQLKAMFQKVADNLGNAPLQKEWQIFSEKTGNL